MKMRMNKTSLDGLLVVEIDFFRDERGFFMESWHKRDFAEAGLPYEFVQDSHSRSTYSVLRGLHYQDMRAPIVKLVRCTVGRVFDVAVDLRVNSPTFGQWFGIELTAENKTQLLVPIGFAHGFLTLSEVCEIQYKQTEYYRPDAEGGVAWNDKAIAIDWPLRDPPILSRRDQNQPSLKQYLQNPAFQ
ncbi:MAG: dTDP-4-dehydrorhamnose 3,5-epimerase [Acidobacteria bacterium]|nr:MAG: dTDP-4-dehydrorhamnose 3,5-epimerase [Acidobacteriota bacterium]